PGEPVTSGVGADLNIVAPGYFRTLGIPLLEGRDFTTADRTGAPRVAIVSKTLAAQLWPRQDALGKELEAPMDRRPSMPLQVVGVAADSRYRSVLDAPPPLVYAPLLQNYDSISRLMAAVDGDPAQFAEGLRRAIQEGEPDLPVRLST